MSLVRFPGTTPKHTSSHSDTLYLYNYCFNNYKNFLYCVYVFFTWWCEICWNTFTCFLFFFYYSTFFCCLAFQVISDYCKSRVQTKPFSHIVMDLHREVMGPMYHNNISPTLYTPATINYLPTITAPRATQTTDTTMWAGGGTLPRQQNHQYPTYNRWVFILFLLE